MEDSAIVVLAHGSQNPRWKRSLEETLLKVQKKEKKTIKLAFISFNKPSFKEAIEELNTKNKRKIKILPLFLGSGRHIEKDIPELVKSVKKEFPKLELKVLPAIGQNPVFHKSLKEIIKQESI